MSKQLESEVNNVMTDIIAAVKYITTRHIKGRVFSTLCEEMGSDQLFVCLFHSESRWLSCGKVFSSLNGGDCDDPSTPLGVPCPSTGSTLCCRVEGRQADEHHLGSVWWR